MRIQLVPLVVGFWTPPLLRLVMGESPRPGVALALTGIAVSGFVIYRQLVKR